jgi:flagellar M-ring protein FliF
MVGEANVRSQVNLSLDFTQSESTTEDFDNRDKGPRTRSEVLAEDRGASRSAEGIPGSLANTPPPAPTTSTNTQAEADKGQGETSTKLSSRSTRNFELDRTVRHVRSASGGVRKVSVAVIVNERPAQPPSDGAAVDPNAPKSVPYTPQELEQMQQVVRGVVGFDSARGDNVTVVPARFEAPAPLETIPWYLENTVQSGLSSALIALSFIVFMMIVVRPIMRNITASKALAEEGNAQAAMGDGELSAEEMRMIQFGDGDSLEEIKAKLMPKKSSISMEMLDTANTYDDKVALIRMMVAEDSGRVANVLKGMIKVS